MPKINVLQPNVFNMIAAGEVVERPSSVVKELLENAIDAGATVVDVSISDGGIKRIIVSDNGVGIAREDLRAAFLPHATSKIKNIDDLDGIATLGFRGEALASIASVSEVSMISKSAQADKAYKIELTAGSVINEAETSRAQGTTVIINNLFFNTPARLKFLKKNVTETHYISDIVKSIALANPHIALSLEIDGHKTLTNEGGNLNDAIYAAYDAKTASNLITVNYVSHSGIKISGFSSSIDFTKPNRCYQTAIVNGRVVSDNIISTAVEKAYAPYLMKRAYPMYILDIIVPFEDVDVNVHPAKTEVRFKDKQTVFGAVFHAIENAITESLSVKKFGFDINRSDNPTDNINTADNLNNDNRQTIKPQKFNFKNEDNENEGVKENFKNSVKNEREDLKNETEQLKFDTSSLYRLRENAAKAERIAGKNKGFGRASRFSEGISYESLSSSEKISTRINDGIVSDYDSDYTLKNKIGNKEANYKENKKCDQNNQNKVQTIINNSNLDNTSINTSAYYDANPIFDGNIIGQIFDTYIIIERDNVAYIIDQHAAHERLLYDKISRKLSDKYSQKLLVAYERALTAEESEVLEAIIPALNSMGFDAVLSSGKCTISAVPSVISDLSLESVFSTLLKFNQPDKDISLTDILKEKLCQQACKAAIKGGEHLTREQLHRVLENFTNEKGYLPEKCPHGRPAVVAVTKSDLEKLFKRIV